MRVLFRAAGSGWILSRLGDRVSPVDDRQWAPSAGFAQDVDLGRLRWLRHVRIALFGHEVASDDRPGGPPPLERRHRKTAERRNATEPGPDDGPTTAPWGLLPLEVTEEPNAPEQQHDAQYVQSVVDRNARLIMDRDTRINQAS